MSLQIHCAYGIAAHFARRFILQTRIPRDRFRWSVWGRGLSGEALVRFVQDEVFAFFEEIATRSATNFMRGARLMITEPTVLTQVVTRRHRGFLGGGL